ncbi:MAG: biotin--[acetyl-CoA-carboxylase] ligase [Phycisphaerae bacterium]|nr:biotin--[acetyl-CoA-carboxylase] ligase [Phycisphaerae bacterium]
MSTHAHATVADKLLRLLYERREGFVTMHELAAAAGASAAAGEQALVALRRRGQQVEVSPGQGVRLVRPVALDARLIEHELGTRRVGRHVLCFNEVDSTNNVARDAARQKHADGLAVLAESQRKGRGRLGRRWISPAGTNVLMSVLLIDRGERLAHEAVTIVAGLAVAEGVDQLLNLFCGLRWPNDVLIDGRKAAGVLVELSAAPSGRAVVVGIGINTNACPPASRLAAPATSLAERVGEPVERIEVARAVLRRLDAWVECIEDRRLEELREAWLSRCGMIHERLTVQCGGHRYVGRAVDIHPLEGLVLVGDHGERIHLPAETSTLV